MKLFMINTIGEIMKVGLVTLISLNGLTIYTMAYMVLLTTAFELLMRVIPVVKYKCWNYDKLNIEEKRV